MDQFKAEPFSDDQLTSIREAIRKKYIETANSPEGLFGYPTGKAGAEQLGYGAELLERVPGKVLDTFCGVGNPFSIEEISTGDAVLDIGCGAGTDLCCAAAFVGMTGRVCGTEMTAEMAALAREGCLGAANVEVFLVDDETLPFSDNSFDRVISNGVINLSPRKLELFREIYRVLKPTGRLQFADIVLKQGLPPGMEPSADNWAQ